MSEIEQRAGVCNTIGCGHDYESHQPFNNGTICHKCARPWEGLNAGGEFHAFNGPRLAGGAYSPISEKEAYDRAMSGEAHPGQKEGE